jgi:C1A family cysteine protease
VAHDKRKIEEIHAAISRAGANWTAGETPLTGLSVEELRLRLGFVPGPNEPSLAEREQAAVRNFASPLAMAAPAGVALPAAYDLRTVDGRNFITPVRDQGGCGSCVAFGVVAALEGSLKVALQDPGLDIDFSEAHLFYCHARALGRTCQNGWWVDHALEAIRRSGLVDEACYPYVGGNQDCANLCGNWTGRLTFIQSWRRYVTAGSMKNWLTSSGPLIACMTVYEDFSSYKSGVYSHVSGKEVGGHCVCIIGYDDAQQCWIAKNSWGPGWGDNGFVRIAYGNVGIDAEMWTVEGIQISAQPSEAIYISQSAPAAMRPGQSYDVAVTMRNVGIETWTPQSQYRLGSQSPQDNQIWGLSRVNVPGQIAPGQDATFRFRVTAPSAAAPFQWRMVKEGVAWFGDFTPLVVFPAEGLLVRYGATLKLRHVATNCCLHSHPIAYNHPGSSGQQQVTCFAGADDNDLWRIKGPDGQSGDVRSGQPVQHGDIIRLEHVSTRRNLHSHSGAPSPVTGQQEVTCFGANGVGDWNDNWRVEVGGGGEWSSGRHVRLIHVATHHALHSHGGFSDPVTTSDQQEVTCFSERDDNDLWFASDFRARDARFVSQSVPSALVAGMAQDVTVTMRNVGTETWTPGGQYRLGSQSPQDNQTWGVTRVELPGPIAPGQDVTFSFRIVPPSTTGSAHFQWMMLQEGVTWFGEPTPHGVIRISSSADPTTVPDVTQWSRTHAAARIRAAELVPKFSGSPAGGAIVDEQFPEAGTSVERGSTVKLRMRFERPDL